MGSPTCADDSLEPGAVTHTRPMYRSAIRATGGVVCACLAKVTSSHCHEASQTSTTQPDGKKAAAWFLCTAALKARWNSEDVQEHFRVFRGDARRPVAPPIRSVSHD